MKKSIALFVAFAFVVTLASVVFGRTLDEEKQAVRNYLKVVDAKIVKYRKAGKTAKVKTLQGEKAATLKRWEKLKAEMVGTTPPPAPTAPVPPPVMKAGTTGGIFGLGMNTLLSGQYINTGKGQFSGGLGLKGEWVMDDMVGLGPMVGLSANAVKFTLGAGYYQGGGGLKAVPITVGGIIALPMGGLDTYLAGGLNYVVYGNGKTSGKIGGEATIGLMADLGLGLGKTGFALGYSVVRSNTATDKGLSLTVSQPILL